MKKRANNSEKNLWFRAKSYGWGWYPSSWQGWLVIATYLILLISIAYFTIPENPPVFFVCLVVLAIILLFICWKTGERPSFRWGKSSIEMF